MMKGNFDSILHECRKPWQLGQFVGGGGGVVGLVRLLRFCGRGCSAK